MPDYRQRVLNSQGKLRQLQAKLPGFSGYMAKESRREADKMLRTYIGRQLDQQKSRLRQLGTKLANDGRLDDVTAVEQVRMRLQTASDRIKTATYGYAGFFDAATVNEPELDALYEFDNSLMDDVEAVASAVNTLRKAPAGQEFSDAVAGVDDSINSLSDVWSRRQDVVTGGAA